MAAIRIAAAVAYPLFIYFGLQAFSVRVVALFLGAVLLARLLLAGNLDPEHWRRLALLLSPMALILVLAAALQDDQYLLFVPSLLSFGMLWGFARSLRPQHGPPMIEVFARIQAGELPEDEIPYCRRLTVLWSLFLAANGLIALALALYGSVEVWAIYTGLVAYGLMGLLFAGEYVYRAWRFRRYQKTALAPLFRRIFPENPVP